ncbi:MAG: hypothetical protein HZA90_19025 [Verrucomicrobia bacterium]|nr:hypothetical protein [Verrucomicrobiota bacterium]
MPLPYKVKTKDEIPPAFSNLYVPRDGVLVLDVEGVIDKSHADELKKRNADLVQELHAHRQRFDGIDPDEVRKLTEEKRKLEEHQLLKSGEVERVVESRIKQATLTWEKQLGALTSERDALNARLVSIQIDQAVVSEATKRGLRATALPDITARARHTFRLVQGVPQAFESDGQTVRLGKDGVTPLSLAEWIDLQVSEAPHLFEANIGSGAVGNGSGGAVGNGPVRNPFRKESWNLTEQMRLLRSDPQLAARLRAAA